MTDARSDEQADLLRDVEVVLVNYRSRPHIDELLRLWPAHLRVAVVDNSANRDGIRETIEARPGTRYIDGGGQGFARGANLGALSSTASYVVFVNPDSRPTADHLTSLVQGLREDPTALSHAATMMRADGETEMGVGGWEPTFGRVLVYALALHNVFPRAGIFARPAAGAACDVEWTTGACMAVDLGRFRSVGGFDELFYVYAEDMALGRRARRAGLRQVLRDDVRVPHGAGRSGAPSEEMLRLRGASFANYMLSYHPPLRAHAVLATISAGYLMRGAAGLVRDQSSPKAQVAFVKGVSTRRAAVGGQEVAQRRYEELSAGLHPRGGLRGVLSRHRAM